MSTLVERFAKGCERCGAEAFCCPTVDGKIVVLCRECADKHTDETTQPHNEPLERAYIRHRSGQHWPAVVRQGVVFIAGLGELIPAGATVYSPALDRLEQRLVRSYVDEMQISES